MKSRILAPQQRRKSASLPTIGLLFSEGKSLINMKQLRVLIAEDNDAMRSYIVVLLSRNYQIVGAVANGAELVQSAMRLEPDVIVSDISMPVLGAFEARNELIAQGKTFPFVFVSIHGKEVFSNLPQDGSVALVYKLEMSEYLSDAVEAVHKEGVWLSPFYRQE